MEAGQEILEQMESTASRVGQNEMGSSNPPLDPPSASVEPESAAPNKLSDEEWRKLLKPAPTQEQVLHILKTSYYPTDNGADHPSDALAPASCCAPHKGIKILQALDSYDDCNYQVEIDGQVYQLKIHNGVESKQFVRVIQEEAGGVYYKRGHMNSVIHLQDAMMHLFQLEGIPSAVPKKPKSRLQAAEAAPPVCVHHLPVVSRQHSPCPLVVRLLSWVPGRTMASIKLLPLEALANAGRFLGRVDRALDRFSTCQSQNMLRRVESHGLDLHSSHSHHHMTPAPSSVASSDSYLDDPSLLVAARRYHQWDGKNTADLSGFIQYIHDDKRRQMIESIIDAFQHELIDSGDVAKFRVGLIHGDFNDANVIMDENLTVAGAIDFGDSVESWRVLDVSIAMAYAMLSSYGKANRSISAAAAMLRGFNSVYPLTDVERKHLVLLIACRLACSVTLGAYSFQQNPENTYLLLHSQPAWNALELIWSLDAERRASVSRAMNRVFHQACLYTDSRESIVTCYDLVLPDPGVADLLQSVRVPSFDVVEPPPRKKPRLENNGAPLITFVTGNSRKLEEVQRILHMDDKTDPDVRLPYHLTNEMLDLPELQGDPITVVRNKCLEAASQVEGAVIVEDTSLGFNALNGLPGVYVKWFLQSCGLEGLHKMLDGFEDKTAYAETVVAFCPGPSRDVAIFDGRTSGKIVPPRGSLAFGWDPIFEPDEGHGRTYAEMSGPEKDAISHRSRAFVQLREYLDKFRRDVLAQLEAR